MDGGDIDCRFLTIHSSKKHPRTKLNQVYYFIMTYLLDWLSQVLGTKTEDMIVEYEEDGERVTVSIENAVYDGQVYKSCMVFQDALQLQGEMHFWKNEIDFVEKEDEDEDDKEEESVSDKTDSTSDEVKPPNKVVIYNLTPSIQQVQEQDQEQDKKKRKLEE